MKERMSKTRFLVMHHTIQNNYNDLGLYYKFGILKILIQKEIFFKHLPLILPFYKTFDPLHSHS